MHRTGVDGGRTIWPAHYYYIGMFIFHRHYTWIWILSNCPHRSHICLQILEFFKCGITKENLVKSSKLTTIDILDTIFAFCSRNVLLCHGTIHISSSNTLLHSSSLLPMCSSCYGHMVLVLDYTGRSAGPICNLCYYYPHIDNHAWNR